MRLLLSQSEFPLKLQRWSTGWRRCGYLFGSRRKTCRKSTLTLLKAIRSYVTVNLLMGNASQLNLNSHIVVGREGNGTPLQYSCLETPIDGGAWWAAVHGVARSRTRLSNFTFTFHFHVLEKETATHSSVLAWRIPGMGEPGGLPSVGSHRVGHD